MRINLYISQTGYCSRREADRLIMEGRVSINGMVAQVGTNVGPADLVRIDGNELERRHESHVYLLLNKPRGIISTTERAKKDNIIDFVAYPRRIFPVGRLDKDTSGLIILTSDGSIVNRILMSTNRHEKEYMVQVDKHLTPDFLRQMAEGVTIYNPVRHRYEKTLPARIDSKTKDCFTIVLTQGLNLQIRRMVKTLGYRVVRLERIRIMNLTLSGLKPGEWRYLEPEELETLFSMLDNNA